MGEAMHMWEEGVHGIPVYFALNVTVNLKLPEK